MATTQAAGAGKAAARNHHYEPDEVLDIAAGRYVRLHLHDAADDPPPLRVISVSECGTKVELEGLGVVPIDRVASLWARDTYDEFAAYLASSAPLGEPWRDPLAYGPEHTETFERAAEETVKPRADLQAVTDAGKALREFGLAAARDMLFLTAVRDRRDGFTRTHLIILAAISYMTNRARGFCWPSYEFLAKLCGDDVQPKNVRNACAELAKWGLIARTDARKVNARGFVGPSFALLPPAKHNSWEAAEHAISTEFKRIRAELKEAGDHTADAIDDPDAGVKVDSPDGTAGGAVGNATNDAPDGTAGGAIDGLDGTAGGAVNTPADACQHVDAAGETAPAEPSEPLDVVEPLDSKTEPLCAEGAAATALATAAGQVEQCTPEVVVDAVQPGLDQLPPDDVTPGELRLQPDDEDGARPNPVRRNKASVRVWPGNGAKSISVSLQWLQSRRPNEAPDDLLDFAASEAERWLAEPYVKNGKKQQLYSHLQVALTPRQFANGKVDRLADFKAARAQPANAKPSRRGSSIDDLMADVFGAEE